MKPAPKLLIICGPTASGKSDLALGLARELDAEIVNADSMQIYRGMDIGTAKTTAAQCAEIPHHLIDIIDPNKNFSAADFMEAADTAIKTIAAKGKRIIVVGGTGLYIRTLLRGLVESPSGAGEIRQQLQKEAREQGNHSMLERLRLVDPELADRIHPNNLVRIIRALEVHQLTGIPLSRYQQEHGFATPRYPFLQIGLKVERQELYQRIDARVERMVAEGLFEEVQGLLDAGYGPELKPMRAIGYKEACAFLAGELGREEAAELIKRDTRRYAKRQMTWFTAEPETIWLEYPRNFASISKHAIEFFDQEV